MLPSDLLISRFQGETIQPKRLALNSANLAMAKALIQLFLAQVGQTQADLNRQTAGTEKGKIPTIASSGGWPISCATALPPLTWSAPLEPVELRQRVFTLATQSTPSPAAARGHLEILSQQLSQELDREVTVPEIRQGLYADLQDNRILIEFDAPTPEALLHRYNLSQTQGVFYRASKMVMHLYRNDPGQYKLMFRYLKLFRFDDLH